LAGYSLAGYSHDLVCQRFASQSCLIAITSCLQALLQGLAQNDWLQSPDNFLGCGMTFALADRIDKARIKSSAYAAPMKSKRTVG
jgi:hypothetical protein